MDDCTAQPTRDRPRGGVPRFESSISAQISAHADERDAFVAWLELVSATPDEVFELRLVFSELVSNAAATSPDGSGHIRVTGSLDAGNLVLSVENPAADAPRDVTSWDLEDPLRGGGRGLVIVRAYTDQLEVTRSPRGAILVRCCRTLGVQRADA